MKKGKSEKDMMANTLKGNKEKLIKNQKIQFRDNLSINTISIIY